MVRAKEPFIWTWERSKFYFYRPNLVAQGKQSFLAIWGTRPNRDNWRLAQRMAVPMARTENQEEQEPIRIQLEDISSLMAQIPASHTDSLKQLKPPKLSASRALVQRTILRIRIWHAKDWTPFLETSTGKHWQSQHCITCIEWKKKTNEQQSRGL